MKDTPTIANTTAPTLSLRPELASSVASLSDSYPSPSVTMNGKLEKVIKSRIVELQKLREVKRNQQIAKEINQIAAISRGSSEGTKIAGYTGPYYDTGDNITSSFVPMWIPGAYVPYILSLDESSSPSSASSVINGTATATANTLGSAEVDIIKNEVLLGSRFYLTSFESVPGAALFRGNMRTSLGKVPSMVAPGTRNVDGNKRRKSTDKDEIRNYDNNTAMVLPISKNDLKT